MEPDLLCARPAEIEPCCRASTQDDAEAALIQAVVQAQHPPLRRCYEELMGRVGADVQGLMVVWVRIHPSGYVEEACVWETELPDQVFAVCILENFEHMQFHRMGTVKRVRYPIMFASGARQ